MRTFKLKDLFTKDGRLDRIILGDFGPVDGSKPKKQLQYAEHDCLVSFPSDPEMCGPLGLARILSERISDRFWNDPKFEHA